MFFRLLVADSVDRGSLWLGTSCYEIGGRKFDLLVFEIICWQVSYLEQPKRRMGFVHWAAAHFGWPGYSENELFSVNKVLNEIDFMPLLYLHDIMIALEIGGHFNGVFNLTKVGKSLEGHPGRIFGIITPFFLFEVNHEYLSRGGTKLLGNWTIVLNILNIEAENGVTGQEIRKNLYGESDQGQGFDFMLRAVYVQVLRPLCWAGLLHQHTPSHRSRRMCFLKRRYGKLH